MNLDKTLGLNAKRALKDKLPHTFFIFFIVVAVLSLSAVILETAEMLVDRGIIYSKFYINNIFGIVSQFEITIIAILAIVYLFVVAPIFYGIINWSAKTADGQHDDFTSFFCCFRDKSKYKNAILLIITNIIILAGIYFLLIRTTFFLFETSIENNVLNPNSEMAAAAFISAIAGLILAAVSFVAIALFISMFITTAYLSTMQSYNGIRASSKRAFALLRADGFMLLLNILLFLLFWGLTFIFFPLFIFAFYFSVKLGIAIKVSDKKLDLDILFK